MEQDEKLKELSKRFNEESLSQLSESERKQLEKGLVEGRGFDLWEEEDEKL
jgi:hypothetical protein